MSWLTGLAACVLLAQALPDPRENNLDNCTFELVIVDDRPLPKRSFEVNPDTFWSMTAVVNYVYAKRHGYGFQYVQATNSSLTGRQSGWHKVLFMAQRLREVVDQECLWFLYIESDAFVREIDTPLPSLVSRLLRRYHRPVAFAGEPAVIFARERSIEHPFGLGHSVKFFQPAKAWLNSGVFLVKANDASRRLFDAWAAQCNGSESGERDHRDLASWSDLDQAVITNLVDQNVDGFRDTVLAVDMLEFNSPWGRFVQHNWGDEHTDRGDAFWDALVRIDYTGLPRIHQALKSIRRGSIVWKPR
ncbi:unnamed protein product [Polarella glacialis]|uniref:Protein xylosyltransferase n=1 Tax=Polarella glacialis TaxID=89957 RepID=A0A813DSD0_POLGL|nr:unnamed protein product [Polarella glacialis]CAE8644377.1 unnamed protein product [Polarella glacialis]